MKILNIGLFANEQLKISRKNSAPSFSIETSQNQRRSSFTSNIPIIPDLNIITDGPGTGKYSGEDVLMYKTNGFTIPRADRPISNLETRKTPGIF